MAEIFISLSGKDKAWGDWIAWQLKEAGHGVRYQHWDFQTGQNFLLLMDEAGREAERVLVILSRSYFESEYTLAELTQALSRDVAGRKGTIIPVVVERVDLKGSLLGPRSYINLTGVTDEGAARRALLDGLKEKGPPLEPPPFPLTLKPAADAKPAFPGAGPQRPASGPESAADPLPAKGLCVGRDAVVKELARALLAREPRPVPVLGGPGIGKSTVCRAALHDPRVARRFGACRLFVRLDGAATAEAMAAAVAQVLGVPIEAGGATTGRVLDALAAAPAALVLDNAETPLGAANPRPAEDLLGRLAEVPGVALLATMRGATYPAGVMWREPVEVRPLADDRDREMFLAIAGRRLADDPRLGDLLRQLDGWPLAIELAAHAAQGQGSLELVWRRWEGERARMLTRAGGAHRLLSLAVSVEISIGGLAADDAARRLLALLALLPDGLRLDDLDALLPDGGGRAASALLQAALAFEEAGRLRMLAPLREHVAAEHPPDGGDLGRLIEHYAGLALDLGPKAGAEGGAEAIARLAAEAANVEAALRRGLAGADPIRAAAAAVGFGEYQRFSGLGTTSLLEAAAAASREAGDARSEADCHYRLGEIALYRSAHEAARGRFEAALPLYRRVRDVRGEANCIFRLGDITLARSAHDEARGRFEAVLPLYRRVGDVRGEANCIFRLGEIALARSAHDEARGRFEAALPLYRRVGAVLGEANCIQHIGRIALARSEYGTARERLEEALPLYRRVGNVLGEAECIQRFGDIALARSDAKGARARYQEALPLFRRFGDVFGEAECIKGLGDVALAQSEPDEARRQYDEALALYGRIPEPHSIGMIHRRLARIAADAGERRRHVAAAREAWRGIGRDDLVRELDEEFGEGT